MIPFTILFVNHDLVVFIGGKWVHLSDSILVMSRDSNARDMQENHLIMIPLKILFVIHDLVVFYWRKMSPSQ